LAKLDSDLYNKARGAENYITRESYEEWVKNTQTKEI